MKIYGYAHGSKLSSQVKQLKRAGARKVFSDAPMKYDIFRAEESQYLRMLQSMSPGEKLLIVSLEVISRDYEQLLVFLDELEKRGLRLQVLNFSNVTMTDFKKMLKWTRHNEQLLYPNLLTISSNSKKNHSLMFSKGSARAIYRSVVRQLNGNKPLRIIARNTGIPLETVARIKREREQLRGTKIILSAFVLSYIGIKITEEWQGNLFIQLVIVIIAAAIVIYQGLFSASDML